MPNPIDRHARKQVLITRIAFERAALRSDVARVHEAARLPNLLRGAFGPGLGRSLFGAAGAAAHQQGGWVAIALSLLRRYRVAAALLGGAAPVLRGRGGWRRLLRLGSLAAALYAGWRLAQRRD